MNWADAAMGVVSGVASGGFGSIIGGALGLGKAWIDGRHQLELKRLEISEAEKDRQHDLDMADKEIQRVSEAGRQKLMEQDLAGLTEVNKSQDTEISALAGVLERSGGFINGLAGLVFTGVTATQKLIRPGVTLYALILVNMLAVKVSDLLGGVGSLGQSALVAIFQDLINAIICIATMATSFWFVTRKGYLPGGK